MFTGLVETVGKITEIAARRGSKRIGIASSLPAEGAEDGASLAVNGVCLTVSLRRGNRFYADAVAETLSRTTLSEAKPGQAVNLERALRLHDRLGGHLVQGHVDAVARVRAVVNRGNDWRLRVELPPEIRGYVALKGSIALHGVSLTVSAVEAELFEVALIPETRARTTLEGVKVGDRLNVEVDLLARYLERMMTVAQESDR